MVLIGPLLQGTLNFAQYILNKEQRFSSQYGPTIHNEDNNIINIQLLYDSNTPTKPEL